MDAKRTWAVWAAWLSVAMVLAACGQTPPTQAPPQAGEQAASEPAQSAAPEPPAAEKPAEPDAVEPPAAALPPEGQAVIYRDAWGVPHIYATAPADAAYAVGYAQAEDRLEDLYLNVRRATGCLAEVTGSAEDAEIDAVVQIIKNVEVCQAYWDEAPDHLRAMGDAFMEGVKAYIAEHPEAVPECAVELHGWQCGAIGRIMVMQWPLGNMMDELKRKRDTPPFGSNGWAVAPSRSVEQCAILLTDPHLTWEGVQVFYEAQIHCAEFDTCGFHIVGVPLPALGHTGHVAWACTTGGPDTSDIYAMKLDPKIPVLYEYDGKPVAGELKPITVNVKGGDPIQIPAMYTVHGPALEEPDTDNGVMYCGKTPYMDQAGLFEQMYAMIKAKNCDEFYDALGMNQFMEQNVIFADRAGNIQYVRVGRTPIRPEGYDWSKPVPGHTPDTDWLGIHAIEDLVQIKNPPQGYMQNCNCSPERMMENSPLTPDKYKPYIYNVSWDHTNPRAERCRALLAADDAITKDDAMAIAFDVYDRLAEPWQNALRAAIEARGKEFIADEAFATAANDILSWDGRFTKDSRGAGLVKPWRLKCENAVDVAAVAKGEPLGPEDQQKLLALLGETLKELEQTYGTLDITYGDMNWIGREGQYFPCDGADFGRGPDKANLTETLLCIEGRPIEGQPGRYEGHVGSESIMLSFLHEDGIESYSCVMWGQSGDPQSPHFVDQAEQLYAERRFKPTWFEHADLLEHVQSETTLTIP